MSVDTPAPLGLFLAEVENQRATKQQIQGFTVTCGRANGIKKMRQHELPHLEAMVRTLFTSGARATHALKPFDLPLLWGRLE